MSDSEQVFEGKTGGLMVDKIGLTGWPVKRVKNAQELASLLIDAVLLSLDECERFPFGSIDTEKGGLSSFVGKLEAVAGQTPFATRLVEEICRQSIPEWEDLLELESSLEMVGRREGVGTSFTVNNPGHGPTYHVTISFPKHVEGLEGYTVPEEWESSDCEGCGESIVWTATFLSQWEVVEGMFWTYSKWFDLIPYREGLGAKGQSKD